MTTYKTSELEGALLDAAVAKAEGYSLGFMDSFSGGYSGPAYMSTERSTVPKDAWRPSTDWSQGGPVIERERISIEFGRNQEAFPGWSAISGPVGYEQEPDAFGPTPLIAAMRAYVASKLGETVELPGKPQGENHGKQ